MLWVEGLISSCEAVCVREVRNLGIHLIYIFFASEDLLVQYENCLASAQA